MILRITVKCTACHSLFRLQRSIKAVTCTPPRYCVYCGSTQVGVTQDHELDADEVLAEGFGLTVENFRKVYEVWHLQFTTEYPHMRDFVVYLRQRKENRNG